MKLHFYTKLDVKPSADGDGTLSSSSEFLVKIASGSVKQGCTYQIRRGMESSGDLYNCLAGAAKDQEARFKKITDSDLLGTNEEQLDATLALYAALQASKKTVKISLDPGALTMLKGNDYKLCFAKKVAEDTYNVVWQSYALYLEQNTFSWTPQYQLFGSNLFYDQVEVQVSTNPVNIGLGEESTLSEAGVLSKPKTGGAATAINMKNEFGPIHPGINQISSGIDGSLISTPIYVAPKQIAPGDISLTPIDQVLVWFEQGIETSTMFSNTRTMSVDIDLTYESSANRLYNKEYKWVTP